MKCFVILVIVLMYNGALGFPFNKLDTGNDTYASPEEFGPYFEGDLKLTPDQIMNPLNNNSKDHYRWENATVHYTIELTFTDEQKALILAAMNEISSVTCIKFVERVSQANYVDIRNGNTGCWSYVGCIRGAQVLNLQSTAGCVTKGVAMHELLHTLGFFHSQSDVNRDDYVTINYDNIISGKEHNFQSYTNNYCADFDNGYDYSSILHSSAYAFSKNGLKTVVPINATATIGQRSYLSVRDINKIIKMYQCVC